MEEANFPKLHEEIKDAIIRSHYELSRSERLRDDAVETAASQAIRRFFRKLSGRRPITDVYVVRIDDEEAPQEG
ncbi:hypothetical protein [Sneathiella glossodoripedis]|uniref:hypothetical protein n=1 Tax=Sneathiella glossodoripedis TaxID=418853 RepID=UPI00190061E4|nr:hypothetical protein [Sneathiella glossodoripedis]